MLTRFNNMGGVKWAFVVTFATTHSLLAAHSGDVPSWLCRNGIDEKPKYKILMKKKTYPFLIAPALYYDSNDKNFGRWHLLQS